MAGFDLEGARKAGYTDAEIVDHLASQSKFNVGQARQAGYSDAELLNHLSTLSPSTAPKPPALSAEDTPGFGQTLLIGAGRTFDRIGKGAKQVYQEVTNAPQAEKDALKAEAAADDEVYNRLKEARPWATGIGESLPAMAVPFGGAGATALGTIAKLGVAGAVPGALEYGTPEERAKAAALGAAGNVVGGVVVPKVVGAVASAAAPAAKAVLGAVTPEAQALYAKAQALGIPVTAAQLGDSKFSKYLASAIDSIPLSGSGKTKEVQQKAFNKAVANTFGEDADQVTREVYNRARTRLGKEFDRLSGQNELKVTPALMTEVNDVISRSQHYTSPDIEKAITNLASDMRSRLDTNTMTVPGSTYQSLDTQMSNIMKAGGEKAIYVGQLQDAFRKAMDLSIKPADAAKWQEVRSQYKNLKAVRDIVGKNDASGDISPALLMGRLNSTEAGKEAMAKGTRGELGDIAEIGRQFITNKVPDSGTAQRGIAYGALGATGALNPAIAAKTIALANLANRANKSSAVKNFMMKPRAPWDISDLAGAPGMATQVVGGGAGMTIADLANQR